jgi:hypothetical protein
MAEEARFKLELEVEQAYQEHLCEIIYKEVMQS